MALWADVTRKYDRRRTLQLGAAATAFALAGCIGGDGGGNGGENGDDTGGENGDDNGGENGDGNGGDGELFEGDTPEYTKYLSSEGTSSNGLVDEGIGEIFLAYIDYDAIEQLESLNFGEQGDDGPQTNPDDPGESTDGLLAAPSGAFGFLFFWGFEVTGTGLAALTSSGESNGEGSDRESEIQAQIFANDAVVLQGDIDTEEVGTLLENPPEVGENEFGVRRPFEFVETVDGYDIYRDTETDDEGNRANAAVGSEEILYGGTRSFLDAVIETARGERERATEAFDGFERVLGPAGDDQMVFAAYAEDGLEADGEQTDIPDIDNSIEGYVSGATFDDDGVDAVAAVLATDPVGEDIESVIQDEFGGEADDVQFETANRSILVTGRYSTETLENI